MKNGGWFPISACFVKDMPRERAASRIEAAYSLQSDIDKNNLITVSGYAKLWGWSRRRVNKFLNEMGVEIVYVGSKHSRYRGGHVMIHVSDMCGPKTGHVRAYDNRNLEGKANMCKSEIGHVVDMRCHTTNHTNTTDNRLTAKNEVFAADAEESYTSKKGRKLTGRVLESFDKFWDAFGYKKGKAEAADVWVDINPSQQKVQIILDGAKREASARPAMLKNGRTPIMAQGWLSGRRWEDEPEQFAGTQGASEWK